MRHPACGCGTHTQTYVYYIIYMYVCACHMLFIRRRAELFLSARRLFPFSPAAAIKHLAAYCFLSQHARMHY